LAGTTSETLQAGQKYNIQLDYFENTQGAQIRLDWQTQGGALARQAVPKSQLYTTTSPSTLSPYTAPSTTATSTAASTTSVFSSDPIDVLDVEDSSVL
jgi:hypothetical protein